MSTRGHGSWGMCMWHVACGMWIYVALAWVGIVPLMLLPLTYNEGNEHSSVFWCVYPD